MGYSNSTKVDIYFDPNACLIKRTFHCYIDEYNITLHQEESMSSGALMLQEYLSGVYQQGNLSTDSKIHLIQTSLVISDSTFASSDILTLEKTSLQVGLL